MLSIRTKANLLPTRPEIWESMGRDVLNVSHQPRVIAGHFAEWKTCTHFARESCSPYCPNDYPSASEMMFCVSDPYLALNPRIQKFQYIRYFLSLLVLTDSNLVCALAIFLSRASCAIFNVCSYAD